MKSHDFSGEIISVLRSGRGAVVRLDKLTARKEYAVINERTDGRIDLMNGRGELRSGERVHGKAVVSVDGLRVINVRKETEARQVA